MCSGSCSGSDGVCAYDDRSCSALVHDVHVSVRESVFDCAESGFAYLVIKADE